MNFKDAVMESPEAVRRSFRPGKQALRPYADKIACADDMRITGSVDIDAALRTDPTHAQAPRWDYGLGYQPPDVNNEFAIWVEVHSAESSEVQPILKKLMWLKNYLKSECPALWKMTYTGKQKPKAFVWISSKGVHITRNSSYARLLAQHGLDWPTKFLKLP